MKKTFLYTILLGASLSSCREEFLDLRPVSNVTTGNYYQTQNDFAQAVTGAYAALILTGQYQEYYNFGELPSDNVLKPGTPGADQVDFNLFTVRPSNGYLSRAWNDYYTGIHRCNTILTRIESVSMDEAAKNRFVAEAKFLRALMYFNLVRIFGPVPVVTTEIAEVRQGYQYGREPVEAVYAQIIKDLTESEDVLPGAKAAGVEFGRATRGAAKALLGKVYLTRRNFPAAAAKLKEVIALGDYSLVADYASLFRAATENNPEMIFAAQFKSGGLGQGSQFPFWFGPTGVGVFGAGAGRGDFQPTAEMARAYEPADKRKAISVDSTGTGGGLQRFTRKFGDGAPAQQDSDNNWPILRLADVYLMYAEALNEVSYGSADAFGYLNEVRRRAGLTEKTVADLPDQDRFRAAVEQERRVELAFEGHRWFDLVRTNKAVEVINAKARSLGVIGPNNDGQINANNLVFPIPQGQVDLNPTRIEQNIGY